MKTRGSLIVLSGFAGVGKGTVLKSLFETREGYAYSVSATTRSPRPGEVDGVHYFFVTKDRFEEMIRGEELLEYANYVGNYYGTPMAPVEEKLEQGIDVLLEIEVQGALKVMEKCPDAVSVFIAPPSLEELGNRLRGRGTEAEETVMQGIFTAMAESEQLLQTVDTENVEEMVYVMPMTNVLREDERRQPFSREDLLAGAPERNEDSWQVPRLVK
jgi:guanylate kinase